MELSRIQAKHVPTRFETPSATVEPVLGGGVAENLLSHPSSTVRAVATNPQSGDRRTIALHDPCDYTVQVDQFLEEVADCVDRLSREVEEMRRELNT